jgi:hypothetical protein
MPTRHFIKLPLALFCALLLGVSAAPAQTPGDASDAPPQKFYDVEVIIFKNKSVPKGKEINLPTPAAEHTPETLDLFDPQQVKAAAKKGFTVLAMDDLRLLEEVAKIVRSSRYQLLAHVGWRQPGLEKSQAIPVWIHGGKIFDKGYSSIDQSEAALGVRVPKAGNPAPDQTLQSTGASGLYELEGAITIILARYLHTQADLVLCKPATLENLLQRAADADMKTTYQPEQILLNYGLKERRRMRSKRLHYLDSPEFGMLVLITPYANPEPEPEIIAPVATDGTESIQSSVEKPASSANQ